MCKKISIFDRLSVINDRAKLIISIVASIAAIFGGAVIGFNWVSDKMTERVQATVTEMSEKHAGDIKELKQSTVRTELQLLMQYNPQDVVAIEMMAEEYFVELDGDRYMTQLYSKWAKEYGGDTSFVKYHN